MKETENSCNFFININGCSFEIDLIESQIFNKKNKDINVLDADERKLWQIVVLDVVFFKK